jgi:sulfite reductase (NADPH) flavoprotein alpha-component
MRQTLAEIQDAYLEKEGSFYLCGPTWPVPDVTEVLQEAVEADHKKKNPSAKKIDSRRQIETLKDEGRYVLEVY